MTKLPWKLNEHFSGTKLINLKATFMELILFCIKWFSVLREMAGIVLKHNSKLEYIIVAGG